ncbi:hypothetical protein [Cesiribacter andamanensis]|uniref:hypothetical protein n=1 Tax=Cesiribacter andamanensis TaxID=649507 RepID=UPI0003453366|nr:hypothetical protein [Cesiribacter andamanensis]
MNHPEFFNWGFYDKNSPWTSPGAVFFQQVSVIAMKRSGRSNLATMRIETRLPHGGPFLFDRKDWAFRSKKGIGK